MCSGGVFGSGIQYEAPVYWFVALAVHRKDRWTRTRKGIEIDVRPLCPKAEVWAKLKLITAFYSLQTLNNQKQGGQPWE